MATNTTTMRVPLSWHIGCHANDPTVIPAYGYIPTFSTGIIFCVFFGLSTLIHLGQTFWRRHWWTLVFSIGAMGESRDDPTASKVMANNGGKSKR